MRQRQDEMPSSFFLQVEEKCQYLDYLKTKTHTHQGRKRLLLADLMLNSGLRANEICRLKIKHLPRFTGVNVVEVIDGKGHKDREVPIPQRLVDAIEDYIRLDRGRTMPRHRRRSDPNGWLFFNQLKKKYRHTALYYSVRRGAVRAGIIKLVRPHKLRHTFATNQVDSGTPVPDLAKWLGHTDLRTTMRYCHVTGRRQFEYVERADQF